ncbi:MAG: hypothetical protein CBC48_09430 [bacterium TMED88]|nr:hypothetical protein [Deltaproteobacteria bacterium]OUV31677.1 MAG: hypothetical protein CBC48_09430 [bacterium TMED88]
MHRCTLQPWPLPPARGGPAQIPGRVLGPQRESGVREALPPGGEYSSGESRYQKFARFQSVSGFSTSEFLSVLIARSGSCLEWKPRFFDLFPIRSVGCMGDLRETRPGDRFPEGGGETFQEISIRTLTQAGWGQICRR